MMIMRILYLFFAVFSKVIFLIMNSSSSDIPTEQPTIRLDGTYIPIDNPSSKCTPTYSTTEQPIRFPTSTITGLYPTSSPSVLKNRAVPFHLSSASTPQPTLSSGNKLTFIMLGDWGKGGNSGTYTSSVNDDDRVLAVSHAESESEIQNTISLSRKLPSDPAGKGGDRNPDSGAGVTGGGNGGGGNKLYQVQVAAAMGTRAASMQPAPSFIVALGDNFYTKGVSSSSDSLWNYLWKDVYLGYDSLNIPWLPVFGNHDYGYGLTGVKAQLQRSQDHTDDDTWIFPSTNYTKVFPIPGSQDTVAIVFVDTTTLAPSENSCCNSKSGVSSTTQKMLIDDQLYHIEKALLSLTTSANPPKWLLMAGHYPVFSGGEHGDTDELVQYLQPLIEEYNVDAYICGHDHISEHLQYGSTHYFVAGAGSMADKLGNTNTQANMVWYGVGYSAFALGEATSTSLTVSFVDTSNAVKYSYAVMKSSLRKRNRSSNISPLLTVLIACEGIILFAMVVFLSVYANNRSKYIYHVRTGALEERTDLFSTAAQMIKEVSCNLLFGWSRKNEESVSRSMRGEEGIRCAELVNSRFHLSISTIKPRLSTDFKVIRNQRSHRISNKSVVHEGYNVPDCSFGAEADVECKQHLRRATIGAIPLRVSRLGGRSRSFGYTVLKSSEEK